MAIIPQEEKVFMVSNSTNTTYSGSAALKAMQQWYTMQDVTDTIKPYKVYTALLTQEGENAPVATVLENTLGEIVWTYDGEGSYYANLTGGFIVGKTWMVADTLQNTGAHTQNYKTLDVIELYTFNNTNIQVDGLLDNTGIEIRVYN